ncbi:hypothetical protein DFH09DRAFT_1355212 [Mycena vulgaris]|nr:hypothetical protein DFH09DRAFT_1355212 [Mycena vulgaris]
MNIIREFGAQIHGCAAVLTKAHDGFSVEMRRCVPDRHKISDPRWHHFLFFRFLFAHSYPLVHSTCYRLLDGAIGATSDCHDNSRRVHGQIAVKRCPSTRASTEQILTRSAKATRICNCHSRWTRYWLVGPESGKKIVLIHGLSVPALVWVPLVPQLVEAGHRVLLYCTTCTGAGSRTRRAGDGELGWPSTRLMDFSIGSAIAAAFIATFPDLVENEVVLVASAGLVESSDLSRTKRG